MWLLDTDHLTLLERGGSAALSLQMHLGQVPVESVGTTIVNYEKQMRGWLAEAARANTPVRVREAYTLLEDHIATFRDLEILSFDAKPSNQFDLLRRAKVRVGTKDFRQVPGLKFEDWSV